MSYKIQLTQNKYTIVDQIDFERVNQFKWYALKDQQGNYRAVRNVGSGRGNQSLQYMSRFILNADTRKLVDHRDHNTLDNRRLNLRECSKIENVRNGKGYGKTSKFRGVCFVKSRQRWRASLTVNSKRIYVKFFKSEIAAANAYNLKALEIYGDFAYQNDII